MDMSETNPYLFLWSSNPLLKFGVLRLQCLLCTASSMKIIFPTGRFQSSEKPSSTATKASKPLLMGFFPLGLDSPFQFLRLQMVEDTFLPRADHKLVYLNVELPQMLLPTFYTPIINPP